MRNAYRNLVWNPITKRLLWRLRIRWEDTIKMDLKLGNDGVDRFQLVRIIHSGDFL
jgi:hypothetical protein